MVERKTYSEKLRNPYTGEFIELSATTENALHNKIDKQYKTWEKEQDEWEHQQYVNEQYQFVQEIDKENRERMNNLQYHMLSYIRRWSPERYYAGLKRKGNFSQIQAPPTIKDVSRELKVPLKIGLWEYISENRKKKRIEAEKNAQQVLKDRTQEYNNRAKLYNQKKVEYNLKIDNNHQALRNGKQQEILNFFLWVIEQDCDYLQGYYIKFQPRMNLYYESNSKTLVADIEMPGIFEISNIKSYQYEEKKDTIKTNKMSQVDFKDFYNHIICDIVLRIICVIYESDEYELVDNVVFNGYRIYLDRSRGKYINDCIISINLKREEYNDIYLRDADGEKVARRVGKNVSTDLTVEPIHVLPIYDSGYLNNYYVKE